MTTLFSWGYWGWGNATREFVRAVDAAERARGFKPPIFYDIRHSRSVRAVGFRGNAFGELLPKGRYKWFQKLGNKRIGSGGGGIEIEDPSAAKILLEEALLAAIDNRRVIFFCACEFPACCHRKEVSKLLLKYAGRSGACVEVVEWPGVSPSAVRTTVKVPGAVFDKLTRGSKNLPLGDQRVLSRLLCLPWGAIVDVHSEGKRVAIISGPAKYSAEWELPVLELHLSSAGSEAYIQRLAADFCKRKGFESKISALTRSKR